MGPGGAADVGDLAERVAWTAHASLMGLPRQDWRNSAAAFDGERVQRLQTAMAAWIGARSLSRVEFEKRFVGSMISDAAIDSLRASAEAVRTATTHHDLGVASTCLASAMQGIGLGRWPSFLRDAADRADVAPPTGGEMHAQLATNTASIQALTGSLATPDNVETLGQIIQSEASGVRNAMLAVGWTVRNRMERNGTTLVSDVQRAYAHGASATDETRQIARSILAGTMADPTNGATHFYTPDRMQKEGDVLRPGQDVSGGLETTQGVLRNGKPIRNYRPSSAGSLDFVQRLVPDVPEHLFKFFAPQKSGRVR